MVLGVIGYTFGEYIYHRWVAHAWLDGVDVGHHTAADEAFTTPWCLTVPFTAIMYGIMVLGGGWPFAFAFMSGFLWCHLWQEWVHWAAHHRTWSWALLERHRRHHEDEEGNFGQATGFWDWVFGTCK